MKKGIHYIWLGALLLCPIVLWILPVDYFNEGGGLACPSRTFFDIECLGCGMTRAVMHFHHFDFSEAIFYNSLVIAVYPFLVWLWQLWIRAELRFLNIWPRGEASA
ncbi:MAG: DUF2752 domain-containing protein [Bacteroidota bacterium]